MYWATERLARAVTVRASTERMLIDIRVGMRIRGIDVAIGEVVGFEGGRSENITGEVATDDYVETNKKIYI